MCYIIYDFGKIVNLLVTFKSVYIPEKCSIENVMIVSEKRYLTKEFHPDLSGEQIFGVCATGHMVITTGL